MSINSRMDEFEKVTHKIKDQDVKGRMEEFQTVDKVQKQDIKEKATSTLPHGLKRYRNCLECGEIMEIEELKETEAIYYCKSCKQKTSVKVK